MPRFIIKLGDYYLEYSAVADKPVTFGMTLNEFKEYYRDEYGARGYQNLDARLAHVEAKGTSARRDRTVDDTLSLNRAGPGESELTRDEIYRAYCLREPVRDGWMPDDD